MRMSQAEKERTHERIVANAARMLRERGVQGTSVADLMGEAGLTHGGFYKHFDSKDALVDRALDAAFADILALLDGTDGFATYQALYLSQAHVENPGLGCPVASVGQEVSRGPAALKATFGRGVNRLIAAVAARLPGSAATRRRNAIRRMCMLVGAVVVARASDAHTAGEVLAACGGDRTGRDAR